MNTHNTLSPGRRPALRKGVAVMLVGLLAGVVFWVVRDGQRGPVELSFVGVREERPFIGVFLLRNNSRIPISYLGWRRSWAEVNVTAFSGLSNSPVPTNDVVISLGTSWSPPDNWYVLMPDQEVEIESNIADAKAAFWQADMRFIDGSMLTGTNNSVSTHLHWRLASTGKKAPIELGPVTSARVVK